MLAFLLFIALVSCAASAHRPIIEDRDASGYDKAIYVPDPDVSRAIYGSMWETTPISSVVLRQ